MLGRMAGLGAGQRSPRVYHAGMDGWSWGDGWELVWVRGLGLPGVALAGQLKCLDSDPICTIKMEGECKKKKKGTDWHL